MQGEEDVEGAQPHPERGEDDAESEDRQAGNGWAGEKCSSSRACPDQNMPALAAMTAHEGRRSAR